MNIKFKIEKRPNNKYEFQILHIDSGFLEFIDSNVLHINHNTKKIVKNNSWSPCYINEYHFSIYLSRYNDTYFDCGSENQLFKINSAASGMFNSVIINCKIEKFDLYLVNAFKSLSIAYKNVMVL